MIVSKFLRLPPVEEAMEDDPLAGIANLFDVSIVFIVGLMITLFSIYRMGDLVDANAETPDSAKSSSRKARRSLLTK